MAHVDSRVLVEVVYGGADEQVLLCIALPAGSTIRDAIERSGIAEMFTGAEPPAWQAGIFGKRRGLDTPVTDGDRVELYRTLQADPRDARRLRSTPRRAQTTSVKRSRAKERGVAR